MNDDEQDYIAMLERTQIPEDHPLIRYLTAIMNTEQYFRPKNGDELMEAIACGKTCEVPNGYGMKALAFLESRISNWSIFFDGSTNKGWSILRPTGDTPEKFRWYLNSLKS